MAVLIAALLDAEAMAFAAEPAMRGVSTRLEQTLNAHLQDAAGSFDVPLTDLVGEADSLILAQMLLAQLPPGLVRLNTHDGARPTVCYRVDLALLRERIRPLKAAG